jgi:hypothetical protein
MTNIGRAANGERQAMRQGHDLIRHLCKVASRAFVQFLEALHSRERLDGRLVEAWH